LDGRDRINKGELMELNIDQDWLRQMADAEDAVGGISIGSVENVKATMEAEERSLLADLRSDYEGELLQVFPTEFDIAQRLLDKGYITRDVDSDDTIWFVRPVEENNFNFNLNGKTIADFRQVSDRCVVIEFDDGTEVIIETKINYNAYDEEWGKYVEEAFLDITID
jgi:hypothetical protein